MYKKINAFNIFPFVLFIATACYCEIFISKQKNNKILKATVEMKHAESAAIFWKIIFVTYARKRVCQ